MTPETKELLQYLEDEVKDCEGTLARDNDAVLTAQKWVEKSKLNYTEAIIALHQFKQERGL